MDMKDSVKTNFSANVNGHLQMKPFHQKSTHRKAGCNK